MIQMDLKSTREQEKFSAAKFVKCLLNEGTKCNCDETTDSFRNQENLPHFYNEILFKRGQQFFNDNVFSLLFSKFLGLLTVLSVPSTVQILMFTKQSGSPLTAYRRYMSTILHMIVWYQSDFRPDSKLWQSLIEVKRKHNFASRRCCLKGIGRITQKDMAFTQFGFIGFALMYREKVGLFDVSEDDLKGFVHLWKVVGFLLGIEDRFNICRDSLEETTEICRIIADELLQLVEKRDENFLEMATHLSDGMWAMNPTLNSKIFLNIVYKLMQNSQSFVSLKNDKILLEMTFFQQLKIQFLLCCVWCLRFRVVKLTINFLQFLGIWLMKVFPFLAYYQFGYANSHVRILENPFSQC